MDWTTEKPTQPGWYWWRAATTSRYIVLCVNANLAVASITPTPNGFDANDADHVDECGGEWAGPIAEPTPLPREAGGVHRQKKVLAWALENFGTIALNRDERAARLVEEAIEVAQAEGVLTATIQKILERVYSRPVGELRREIGGVAITLDALAENAGIDAQAEGDRELTRVLSLSKEHWKKKHAEKVAAGTADLSPLEPWP